MRGSSWLWVFGAVAFFPAIACGGTTVAGPSAGGTGGAGAGGGSGQGGVRSLNIFVETLTAVATSCLARVLLPDPQTGKIPCIVIEARTQGGTTCDASRGRSDIDARFIASVLGRLKEQGVCDVGGLPPCTTFTLCVINEAGPECHQAGVPEPLAGWCYIDPAHDPNDDPSLVANCPTNEQRSLRFVDPNNATPAPGTVVLLACFGSSLSAGGAGGSP